MFSLRTFRREFQTSSCAFMMLQIVSVAERTILKQRPIHHGACDSRTQLKRRVPLTDSPIYSGGDGPKYIVDSAIMSTHTDYVLTPGWAEEFANTGTVTPRAFVYTDHQAWPTSDSE